MKKYINTLVLCFLGFKTSIEQTFVDFYDTFIKNIMTMNWPFIHFKRIVPIMWYINLQHKRYCIIRWFTRILLLSEKAESAVKNYSEVAPISLKNFTNRMEGDQKLAVTEQKRSSDIKQENGNDPNVILKKQINEFITRSLFDFKCTYMKKYGITLILSFLAFSPAIGQTNENRETVVNEYSEIDPIALENFSEKVDEDQNLTVAEQKRRNGINHIEKEQIKKISNNSVNISIDQNSVGKKNNQSTGSEEDQHLLSVEYEHTEIDIDRGKIESSENKSAKKSIVIKDEK